MALVGGQYCVEVTDSAGCLSKDCVNIKLKTDRPNKCRTKIKVEKADSNGIYVLTALASSSSGNIYKWSTGETTQTIKVKGGDIYCVTVIDSNGLYSNGLCKTQ